MSKPVLNQRYELANHSVVRQIGMWIRMKTSVLGFLDTGPGLKNLIILLTIHYAGKPLFWLRTRIRNQHALRAKLKSLLGRT